MRHDIRDMLTLHSPSGYEVLMVDYVTNCLDKMRVPYDVCHDGTIYAIYPGRPLLSAHMDTVCERPPELIVNNDMIMGRDCCIGADDKCGVWITLNTLQQRSDLSFIFSVNEEIGQSLTNLPLTRYANDICYALVLDRCGKQDLIGRYNGYNTGDLGRAIQAITDYHPATGVYSDADILSGQGIPCVNLSVGYYGHHTRQEYLDKRVMVYSLRRVARILDVLGDRYFQRVSDMSDMSEDYLWDYGGIIRGYYT